MRVAAFQRRPWPEAIRIAGDTCIEIPSPPNAAHFETTLEDAIEHGRRLYAQLKDARIDLLVDTHGDGLLFVDDPREKGMSTLLHERLGVPLVSWWTETLRILFKRFDPVLLQRALQSPTWFKGVFTTAHVEEMAWLRIPGCFYLPLALDELDYPDASSRIESGGPKVFFAGHQQSRYFSHADGVDVRTQRPGAWALAAVSDGSASAFIDAYRRYEFGARPQPDDAPQRRAELMQRYFGHKMFFAAARNLGTRDRFIVFLKKHFGDGFLLVGDSRWREYYGLCAEAHVERSEYTRRIESTPICVNFVNGDNDTGLNLRHFEITAAGGFLLSYHHPELADFFEVGQECESFRNERELLDKIGYYLEHPDRRFAIARAGQRRTRTCHLLHHRYQILRSWLQENGHLPCMGQTPERQGTPVVMSPGPCLDQDGTRHSDGLL